MAGAKADAARLLALDVDWCLISNRVTEPDNSVEDGSHSLGRKYRAPSHHGSSTFPTIVLRCGVRSGVIRPCTATGARNGGRHQAAIANTMCSPSGDRPMCVSFPGVLVSRFTPVPSGLIVKSS